MGADIAYYKAAELCTRISEQRSAYADMAGTVPADPYILTLAPPALNAPVERAWRILEVLLPKWKQDADQHQAELWVVPTGSEEQENPDPSFRENYRKHIGSADLYYWDKRIERIAERNQIRCFRIAPLMADYATQHHLFLHGFFYRKPAQGHWNSKGNEIAADLLASNLLQFSNVLKQ